MANWYGSARTNYFRVRDLEAFRAAAEPFNVSIEPGGPRDPADSICLLALDGEGWPSPTEPCDDHDSARGDGECVNCGLVHSATNTGYESVADMVAAHLIDGDVAVFMEVGAENLRYLTGMAVAVNSRNERVSLNLDDIYELAKPLGTTITVAAY